MIGLLKLKFLLFLGTIPEQFGHCFIDFGPCSVGAQIQDLYTNMEKKFKLFVNYDKWSQKSILSYIMRP